MIAPVAKTKAQEAVEFVINMDDSTQRKVSDFEMCRFRKIYNEIGDQDLDSYFFCKAFDAAVTGDLDALKENIQYVISHNPDIHNTMNVVKLCERMGLFNLAATLADTVPVASLGLDDALQIADSFALVGLTKKAQSIIDYVKTAFPQFTSGLDECISVKLIKEINDRGITSEEISSYWNQFEDKLYSSLIKPKLFELRPIIVLHNEEGPTFVSIEFTVLPDSMEENKLWEISDAIADKLSEIASPIDVLMLFISDIHFSSEHLGLAS